MEYILLLVGFVLLIKGADFFVDGASIIADLLRVPPILIGLTVVAFGTSAPEASVSISAAMGNNGGIALGNIIGSNIFNLLFIIGFTAIIHPLKVLRASIRKEIPFAILASVVLFIMMADKALHGYNKQLITRADGLILLVFFSIFLFYIFEVATNSREKSRKENRVIVRKVAIKSFILTLGGLAMIVFGGDIVVKNSSIIATSLGMSQTLVGLTIVGIGTSLPELTTSIVAALKKQSDIAVGNVIGSNIFNILLILGVSSTISPVMVDKKMFLDAIIMIVSSVMIWQFSKSLRRITKIEGVILILSYVAYMAYIIIRN